MNLIDLPVMAVVISIYRQMKPADVIMAVVNGCFPEHSQPCTVNVAVDSNQHPSEPYGEHESKRKATNQLPLQSFNNHTLLEESDEEDLDMKDLIASLENSDRKLDHQPVPKDLRQLIDNLCTNYSVGDPIWMKSPTGPKAICIRGRGVEIMREELEKEFPSYTFTLKESGPMHTKQLCGGSKDVVMQRFCVNDGIQRWSDRAEIPFQLLVLGTERNKQTPNRALFAVVPAHSIVGEQECEQMAEEMKSIDLVRQQTNTQAGEVQHVLRISDLKRYDLGLPAMIAYRRYYTNINTSTDDPNWRCCAGKCSAPEGCPHMHMNNIAVLRVEKIPRNLQMPRQGCRAVRFDRIIEFNKEEIDMLIENDRLVFVNEVDDDGGVREVKGQLWSSPITGDNNPERTVGIHVTFLASERSEQTREIPLVPGTVVYVKSPRGPQAKRFAFAMIIGGTIEFNEWHYQAILLMPALRDIEMDYPHLVGNIKNCSRPPCCYLSAD